MSKRNIPYNMITVLGHTAGGKTRFAACLADRLGTEVISADSRQVYRRMNLGTGKDYADYIIDGKTVKVHLIDILEPGSEYNVYEYQKDFLRVYRALLDQKKIPVLCGGSGMYIEAVLKGYRLIRVPVNKSLREELEQKSMEELTGILAGFRNLHNKTDTGNRKRLIRALEIESYYRDHPAPEKDYPEINSLIVGIKFDRDLRRLRISQRLQERLDGGMADEVESLLSEGITPEKLIYYGLEYKFLAEYLCGKMEYKEMVKGLETAIHQFAKRQMTWFRGMERRGLKIHWLEGHIPMGENIQQTLNWFKNPT